MQQHVATDDGTAPETPDSPVEHTVTIPFRFVLQKSRFPSLPAEPRMAAIAGRAEELERLFNVRRARRNGPR